MGLVMACTPLPQAILTTFRWIFKLVPYQEVLARLQQLIDLLDLLQ